MTEYSYTLVKETELTLGATMMLGSYTMLIGCIVSFPANTIPFVRLSDTAKVEACLFDELGPVPPEGLKPLAWEVPPGCRLVRADGTWHAVEIQEALRRDH